MTRAKLDRSRPFGVTMPSGHYEQDYKTFGPDDLEIVDDNRSPGPQPAERAPEAIPPSPAPKLSVSAMRAEIKRRTGKAPKVGTPEAAMAAQLAALDQQATPVEPATELEQEESSEFG